MTGRLLIWSDAPCLIAGLMTSADGFFRTFEQAVSYYQLTMVNYIGFTDRGMLLVGGCGGHEWETADRQDSSLTWVYEFGKKIYLE